MSTAWIQTLPPAPKDLLDRTVFRLTVDEAQFIVDRLIATQLTALLTGRELAFLRAYDVTVGAVRDALTHLATREEAQPQLDGRMDDKTIAGILDAVEAREILKVLKLFRQIRRELPQPRARLNCVWFEPDARVNVGGEIERQPRVFVTHSAHRGCAKRRPCSLSTAPARSTSTDGSSAIT